MKIKEDLIHLRSSTYGIVVILNVIVCFFYLYLSSKNQIVGLIADDAMYLLMADYFSPYNNSISENAGFVMQTSQFPPLYPLLLSVLGATSEKVFWAHILTTLFLMGAFLIYYYWLRLEKVSNLASICLIFIVLCSPASFLMNIDLWSEHLYLLLIFFVFYFLSKTDTNKNYQLIVAVFIGFIPLVRAVGLVIVVGYFLYLHLNNIKDKYKFLSISLLPYIIWKIISFNFFQTDIYQDTLSDFYNHSLWSHIKYLFTSQLFDLWEGWHECFDIRKNNFSGIISGVILALSLITLFIRLADKKMDSLYIVLYLLIIWIWPDDNHNMRFMFVIFPILLFYAYLTLQMMTKIKVLVQLKTMISTASVLIILITFMPTNIYALNRLSVNTQTGLNAFKVTKFWLTAKNRKEADESIKIMDRMIFSYRHAGLFIPENECVYTAHQEQFMFYARKLAFSLPLKKEIINGDIMNNLSRCNYIHVLHTTSHPQFPGGYPIKELNNRFDYLMSFKMDEAPGSPVVAEILKIHKN